MPALAAPAEETRRPGWEADGLPELASFRAAFPGYEETRALDGRASEYWYLDAEGQIYLDCTGAGLPAQAQLSASRRGCTGGASGTRTRRIPPRPRRRRSSSGPGGRYSTISERRRTSTR